MGRLRERIGGFFRGRPAPQARAEAALESSLVTLVVAEIEAAADRTRRGWQALPGGLTALTDLPASAPVEQRPALSAAAGAMVREWQRGILDLVRAEGEDRRTKARMLSLGVNASGIALMLVVFAFSGGLTLLEAGVAGGTAVIGQKVLEMVFGEQAVRDMARRAREDLATRTDALLEEYRRPWLASLEALDDTEADPGALEAAIAAVYAGLRSAGMTR